MRHPLLALAFGLVFVTFGAFGRIGVLIKRYWVDSGEAHTGPGEYKRAQKKPYDLSHNFLQPMAEDKCKTDTEIRDRAG